MKPPKTAIAPARRVAFEVLKAVVQGKANSDALLRAPSMRQLSVEDRNLATALVMGTLRWQRVLDAECRRFLSRPDIQRSEDLQLALRIGAFQLLFLDRIPAHAAIFESVEWSKHSAAARQSGLINAVLRKVAAQPKPRKFDPVEAVPEWMTARWRAFYGADACRQICEQAQQEPRTVLRLLRPEADTELRAAGFALAPGEFLAKARHGEVTKLPMCTAAQIQDEGAQLVAELLGTGNRILDCCAAPGNKTAILLANNPSAELVACDLHPKRLDAMERRLSTLFPENRIEYRRIDAAAPGSSHFGDSELEKPDPPDQEFNPSHQNDPRSENYLKPKSFDRILCDVPCSGTGTLARNPEIRHRLRPEDLARQAARQRAILSSALQWLAPGGRLLYSTCSLEPEENEQVVDACLRESSSSDKTSAAASGGLHWLDLGEEFDLLTRQGIIQGDAAAHLRATAFHNGCLRTLPGVHPCDGFFAAMIGRR